MLLNPSRASLLHGPIRLVSWQRIVLNVFEKSLLEPLSFGAVATASRLLFPASILRIFPAEAECLTTAVQPILTALASGHFVLAFLALGCFLASASCRLR